MIVLTMMSNLLRHERYCTRAAFHGDHKLSGTRVIYVQTRAREDEIISWNYVTETLEPE